MRSSHLVLVLLLSLIVIPVMAESEAVMEVSGVMLSFPQQVPSGSEVVITARYEGRDYKIVMLIPPPGIKVENSLVPISFFFHVPNALDCKDPELKWKVRLNSSSETQYTFKLMVISAPYSVLVPSITRGEGRIEFGNATMSEVSFTITAYNITGIKLLYQQQLSAVQQQLAQLQQDNARLSSEVASLRAQVKNLTEVNERLNRTLMNMTAFSINMFWENKAVGFIGTIAMFGLVMLGLPYATWKLNKKRFDERMKGRRL